jgi:hypothetical protein
MMFCFKRWDTSVKRYLKIFYKDTFGVEHTEYYIVELIDGSYKLSNDEGEKIFEEYEVKYKNYEYPTFERIPVEKFYELVMKS